MSRTAHSRNTEHIIPGAPAVTSLDKQNQGPPTANPTPRDAVRVSTEISKGEKMRRALKTNLIKLDFSSDHNEKRLKTAGV